MSRMTESAAEAEIAATVPLERDGRVSCCKFVVAVAVGGRGLEIRLVGGRGLNIWPGVAATTISSDSHTSIRGVARISALVIDVRDFCMVVYCCDSATACGKCISVWVVASSVSS